MNKETSLNNKDTEITDEDIVKQAKIVAYKELQAREVLLDYVLEWVTERHGRVDIDKLIKVLFSTSCEKEEINSTKK
ncbi:hypothetical protein HAV_00401 [Candidatus Hepatincola sp. Av]